MKKQVFIVAEVGKNFIQTPEDRPVAEYLENAKALALAAKEAGANAVKFQTHTFFDEQIDTPVVSPHFKGSDRYSWVKRNTEATPLETFWRPLAAYCKNIGITFFSTPMSRGAAKLLEKLSVHLWKVGSGDILDFVMLDYLASTKKPIIISTGMSTLEEIDLAINFLKKRTDHITLLHCVSKYPCPPEELNLATIKALNKRYGLPVGFSDHSIGIERSLAAVKVGATVIEKHFSFSRELWGSDHKVSMTPKELSRLAKAIRSIEKTGSTGNTKLDDEIEAIPIGNEHKILNPDEAAFRPFFRKSLVAACDIPAGTILSDKMIFAMRPQSAIDGFPSEAYEMIIGRKTRKNLSQYEPLNKSGVNIT